MNKKVSLTLFLSTAITLSVFAQIPTNELIGYWPFSANALDESGYENNGTVDGATLTTDRFGRSNSAYEFDGINDFIRIKDDSILNPDNITISVWYKPVAFAGVGNNPVLQKAYTSHTPPYYQYHVGVTGEDYDNGGLRFSSNFSINGQRRVLVADTAGFETNTWYMLTTTYDGEMMKFYVNDVLMESTVVSGGIESYGQDIYIGKFGNQNLFTPGAIDDIVMYSRAIDSSEVVVLYNNGNCTDTTLSDTTTYYVANEAFEEFSPQMQFFGVDSLIAYGGCDSVVNRYVKYEFNAKFCTETVYDTVVVYDSIAVTDTLIIDVELPTTGVNGQMVNVMKVYPNPAKDFVIINTGVNFETITDYTLEISNTAGGVVFQTRLESSTYQVDVSDFAVTGLYYLRLYNENGELVHSRKLILE